VDRGIALVSMAVAIVLGATSMNDITLLAHHAPVLGAEPSDATVRRTLELAYPRTLDKVARVLAVVRAHVWSPIAATPAGFRWHPHGAVLGQVDVAAKTNEIPMFSTLLDRIDIIGAVITADALHAQHSHATNLARRRAHYLLIVKRNQPGLHAQLAALPWRDVPVAYQAASAGTAAPSGATSRSRPSRPGWPSPTPPRPSRSPAAAKRRGSGPARPATRSPR
jgi:hypothetical protein